MQRKKSLRESEVSFTITPGRIGLFHLSQVKQEDPSENKYRGKTNFIGWDFEETGSIRNPSSGLPVDGRNETRALEKLRRSVITSDLTTSWNPCGMISELPPLGETLTTLTC